MVNKELIDNMEFFPLFLEVDALLEYYQED